MSALLYLGLKRADIEQLTVHDWQAYCDGIDELKRKAASDG